MVMPVIDQSRDLSIQERADPEREAEGAGTHLVRWLAKGSALIAPWWSQRRDQQLREFWKKSDHLSGALYNMTSKMTAIPNRIEPRDPSIKAHVEQAKLLTNVLHQASDLGNGWVEFYSKWVEDLLTQDNGAFAEIIGGGSVSGPILGRALSVAHLDAWRCTRTGHGIYPVIYMDTDGKRYKLHWTRVLYTSQMSSPIAEMYGVGVSAVSRCINIAQNMIDIVTYKQEKMGSRPHREVILTQGGLDPGDLTNAFLVAASRMDADNLSRYSKIIIAGSSTLPEADAKQLDLASLPDGFDEQTNIVYGMAAIALALGVDARELFPAMTAGATRADALVQHLKQRGKGPGQILQVTEQLFNFKVLPPHMVLSYDYQDDAADRQSAEIKQIRANTRVQDLATGTMPERAIREIMFANGDIDQSQFERMELESGRLPDGTPTVALFYAKNDRASTYLDLGVADPLDIEGNDPDKMLEKIQERRKDVLSDMINATGEETRWATLKAKSALDQLAFRYKYPEIDLELQSMPDKPQANYIDPRTRNMNVSVPQANAAMQGQNDPTGKPNPDNKPE
jgi:hypothetical protein